MPAPKIVENLELVIEDGDCRPAAHTFLAVMAYPAMADAARRARFVAAADVEYLRWVRRLVPPALRSKVIAQLRAIDPMPAQQSNNVLGRGMKRVGHRLAAAEIFRALDTPSGKRRIEWDGKDTNSVRVIIESANVEIPSVFKMIRDLSPRLHRLIPIGDRDEKAFKNIQDRIVRPSYPLLHLAHALLNAATAVDPMQRGFRPAHWASRLLMDPTWIRDVVRKGMAAREAYWLMFREVNMIFPFEDMLCVELTERARAVA